MASTRADSTDADSTRGFDARDCECIQLMQIQRKRINSMGKLKQEDPTDADLNFDSIETGFDFPLCLFYKLCIVGLRSCQMLS